jgi:thioesterase domain-containing protein
VALLTLFDAAVPGRLTTRAAKLRHLRQRIAVAAAGIVRLPRGRRLPALREKAARAIAQVAAGLARAAGRESAIDRATREIAATHLQAMRAYRPKPYDGRITLFLSPKPPIPFGNPALEWKPLASGGLEVVTVAGDQGTIVDEPRVRALVAALRARVTERP